MIPSSVSALVRARRVPAYTPADIERQVKLIESLKRQHKSTAIAESRLVLMRAAQLVPAALAAKQQRRSA